MKKFTVVEVDVKNLYQSYKGQNFAFLFFSMKILELELSSYRRIMYINSFKYPSIKIMQIRRLLSFDDYFSGRKDALLRVKYSVVVKNIPENLVPRLARRKMIIYQKKRKSC
uniref:Uncharacterized protein n=1 Tax=Romanomermis culicivorax TaxID=13658 RepID=A0A915HS11_ROMCU